MKSRVLPVAVLTLLSLVLLDAFAIEKDKVEEPKKLLRHVVLFKFKPEVNKEQIKEVSEAFAALPTKIDEIADFEMGTDVSVENKHKGFTHGYLVSFQSLEDRDNYLPHAAHKDFIALVGPRVADVLVFDYWTKE